MEESNGPGAAKPHGHPMLRGGRRTSHSHGLSASQIKSLASICDTFIPSVPPPDDLQDPEVESFYGLSGSQNGIPEQVAELMSRHVKPIGWGMARWLLWLLSTRLGTWMLCGSASLKKEFPYLQAFSDIQQVQREQILLDWSRGKRFKFLKFAFKLFKICSLFSFYTVADENAENPAWKGIGYSPPKPDTDRVAGGRPLEKGVIDLSSALEKDLPRLFQDRGFRVTEEGNLSGKEKAWKVECDAVVIGSGSGGGVAAGVLAKAGYRVIVLEKGKYYARDDLTLLEGPSFDQMYESGGILSTNDAKFLVMAGATVGGGSAINWSACIRTPPHVLKEWSKQHGLPLFESQDYQEAMNAVCGRLGVQDGCAKESFQNSVLTTGCAKLGLRFEKVPRNSTEDHFCGSCCYGCRTGNKKGADETWLVDAIDSGSLILAGCKAEKVLCQEIPASRKQKAAGVVASFGPQRRKIFVQAKVTVAACGSLLTPLLLRSSGLRNPNIGRNLHLHPVQMAWGFFPENQEPAGKPNEGGIITTICKEDAKWEQSGYGTIIQTPAMAPGSFAALIPWISGLDMKKRMQKYHRTAHVFCLARDRGSGSVGREKDIEYRLAESDKDNLKEGLRRCIRILIAAGATEVGTHRSDGERLTVKGATDDEIEEFLNRQGKGRRELWPTLCSAHQMGSCRMGTDEESGGVDWKGQSWEVEGLFVCDGSLLPTAVGVNPMITIQSVAFCVAKYIRQFLRSNSSRPSTCGH